MGVTINEHKELTNRLNEASKLVKVGAEYIHYKSDKKRYKVIDLAFLEENLQLCVVYKAMYDYELTFIRSIDVWLEDVEWNGEKVKRFRKA